jgi:hypothetical protein
MPQAAQPDPILQGFEAEIAAIRAQTGTRSQPITGRLLARQRDTQLPGGGVRTMQIHPDGPAAAELRNMGITPRTRPGLFSRRGTREFDNLVASEWEGDLPGISGAAGVDGNGYLNQDGFLRVLADELNGKPSALRDQQRLAEVEAQMEEYLRFRDAEAEMVNPLPQTSDGAELRNAFDSIVDAVNDAIRVRGMDDLVSPSERDAMVNYLAERGGRPADLLDDMDTEALDFAETSLEGDDGRPFAERDATDLRGDDLADARELPQGRSDPVARGPDTGATGGGAAGQGTDRSPRTERTAAGDQTLIPGVEPITERQRLEQRQAQPLAGGQRGPDSTIGGLFDPYDKARMDLFSEPTAKPMEDVNRIAANDMREAIEADGDFTVTAEGDNGDRRTMSASQWLDDLDADEEFVQVAELCGIGRTRQ